jgi:CubicO group peptidase (beta-lactamase class C family)
MFRFSSPLGCAASVVCSVAGVAQSPAVVRPSPSSPPGPELPALVAPSAVGMDAGVLEAGAGLFRRAVERDDLRGVVLLVARRGKTVLHTAYGWRDAAKQVPMRLDTLFRLASNTKPIVATAVLILAEQGKIDLQAPVGRYLPAFDNERNRGLTIHSLLSHTSGLRIGSLFMQPLMQPSKQHPNAPTLRLEVDRFAAVGPAATPGESWSYSNPGFNILGALVETVSGEPLGDFMARRIYQPLGMTDSCHHETVADQDRMSAVFRRQRGGAWRVAWRPGGRPTLPFVRASGGGIGTAADYAKFLHMWLGGGAAGAVRILQPPSVAAATQAHSAACYPPVQRRKRVKFYGYGWSVRRNGIFEHAGSDGTFAWVDPAREVVGLVFTQSPGGENPRAQFMRVVAASIGD